MAQSFALCLALAATASAQLVMPRPQGSFDIDRLVTDLDSNHNGIISAAERTAFTNSISPGRASVARCEFDTRFVNNYRLSIDDANNVYDILAAGDRVFTDSDWQGQDYGDVPVAEFQSGFIKVVSQAREVTKNWRKLVNLTRQYYDQMTLMQQAIRDTPAHVASGTINVQ